MTQTKIAPKEIFEAGQILTVKAAEMLKGKTIAFTHPVYRANKSVVEIITVGEIISEWDLAGKDTSMPGYASRQEYWASYFSAAQIDEAKTKLVLLKADGAETYCYAHTKYWNFYSVPTFTCSDADREVYYVEVNENEFTGKPNKVYYRDGEPLSEEVIEGYFLNSKTGMRYYNLYASFDAKLNIETGESFSISHPDFAKSESKTINKLLSEGTLIDKNYNRQNA